MSINRNAFIESFARSTPSLNLVFLNHAGAPSKLLTDIYAVELLSDKSSTLAFVDYCKSHPLVKSMSLSSLYRKTQVLVEFKDGSELRFILHRNMVRKTMLCLHSKAIRSAAFVNSHGMLVASTEHHYEFMMLKTQIEKVPLSDRYRNYFSDLDPEVRATIFSYMQTRFNLVFNTLEDLYDPKPKILLALLIGLRAEHKNTLFMMFCRGTEQVFTSVRSLLFKNARFIEALSVQTPEYPSNAKHRTAKHAI